MHFEKKQKTRLGYWTVRVGMTETILWLINCVNFDIPVGGLLETWKSILEFRKNVQLLEKLIDCSVLKKGSTPWRRSVILVKPTGNFTYHKV
jgi:hypothetical protein